MSGMGEHEVPEGPTIGEQLGIGKHWQAGPVSWSFGTIEDPLAGRVHVVVIDTIGGRTAIVLSAEDLRSWGRQAMEAAGGLVIP